MVSSQLLKGVLDPVILKIISRQETYGYEIVESLREMGLEDIQEGTVYPVILRLEKKGSISSERKKSAIGPVRKYLTITDQGQGELEEFLLEWQALGQVVDSIFKDS